MKNFKTTGLLPALVLGTSILMAACSTSNGYVIEGKIAGDSDGKTVYLLGDQADQVLDSTVIADGAFRFSGELEMPTLLTVKIFPTDFRGRFENNRYAFRPVIPVFVHNGKVSIEAVLDSIPLETFDGSYDFSKVTVNGPEDTRLYMSYNTDKTKVMGERSEAFNKYIAYLNPRNGKKGPVSEGIAAVNEVDRAGDRIKEYVRGFVSANKGNSLGAYALGDNLSRFDVGEIDAMLAQLAPEVQSSPLGMKVAEKAEKVKRTAIGAPYVDFEFQDSEDKPVKLSDHVGKGKYVLLEFWASWCGPCRSDIPHLKEVYGLYHPEGFEVISISMDNDKEAWLKALEQEKMPWLQVSDLKAFEGELSKIYNFSGIPTCVLVSPDGKIVSRNMRGSWMDRDLIEMYGNKFGDKY